MSNNNRKAIAIDGNSLLYRCFYATFKQLPYYAQHNIQPTNALNLFVYSILKLLTSNKYDYAIVAFDHGKRTFRTGIYFWIIIKERLHLWSLYFIYPKNNCLILRKERKKSYDTSGN